MITILRRLNRQKVTTLFKIVSMGIGIASSLILLYIAFNQLSTDKFYKDRTLIYQVFSETTTPNLEGIFSQLSQPVVPSMMEDLAPVQFGTAIRNASNVPYVFAEEIMEARTIYADSVFFKIFERPFMMGVQEIALSRINSAVVTSTFANKVFGRTDVVGETLHMHGSRYIDITGVIEDWPQNSSFDAEVIISFETLHDEKRLNMSWYGGESYQGYIKLMPGTDVEHLESSFPAFLEKYIDMEGFKKRGFFISYMAIPITKAPYTANPRKKSSILILFLLGGLLLGLVCFNAVLLSISQQQKMQKELQIRRIHGFSRSSIFKLLLFDALFQFSLSLLVSVVVAWYISPLVLSNYNINLASAITTPSFIVLLAAISSIVFVAIFVVPGQWSLRQLRRNQSAEKSVKRSFVADIPLALQVGISFTLLVFFWFIFSQLAYIQNYDKGYTSDNLVYVELNNEVLYLKDKLLKSELEQIRGVESVCLSDNVPLYGLPGNNYSTQPGGEDRRNYRNVYVDEDFFETLDMKMSGSGFSQTAVNRENVVITELVAEGLGLENPINESIYQNAGKSFTIVGVVPDIVSGSIHTEKSGIVFSRYDEPYVYSILTIRIAKSRMIETVKDIRTRIEKIVPGDTFQVKYYESGLRANYQSDYAIKKTVSFFAVIAAILTIAGLVGFSISSIQKRVKEIGVRKVNGAGEWSIVLLLNRSFLLKSFCALLIFSPLSWWLITTWLNNYAYHVQLRLLTIAALLLLILGVVFTTILLAVWNTVKRNPAEALRYE